MNLAVPINFVKNLYESSGSKEQSVKDFYISQHSQFELDEYYVGIRSILIPPADLGDEASWDEALGYAEDVYSEWISGSATEDSFIELAEKYDAEKANGQLSILLPGEIDEPIDKWCFDKTRKRGDITIIEWYYGYFIVYYSGAVRKPPNVSEYLSRRAAEEALEIDRVFGPDAHGGSAGLNEK